MPQRALGSQDWLSSSHPALVDPHSCGFLDATVAIQELVGPHSCGFLDATLSSV